MKCVCAQNLVSASYSSHPARTHSSHPSECLRHISIKICVPVHLSRFARIASLPLHLSRFARRLRLRLLILPRLPRRLTRLDRLPLHLSRFARLARIRLRLLILPRLPKIGCRKERTSGGQSCSNLDTSFGKESR